MPYVKKYNKKYSKKNYKRNNKNFARRVKKVILSEAENKYIDNSLTSTNLINTNPVSFSYIVKQDIPEGTGENQRIGNSIHMKGFSLKMCMESSVSHSTRFLLLLIDNFSTAIDTLVDSDFDDTNVGLIGQLPRNVTGYKYKVLMDRTYNYDPDSKGSVCYNKYFKLNKIMEFVDSTTLQPITNKLMFYVYTNNTTASSVTLSMNTRLFVKDT